MSQDKFASKINDLTNSLNRTTDVLSTADRMIDHYRDLSREQEHEIARLQNDLHYMSSMEATQRNNEVPLRQEPLHQEHLRQEPLRQEPLRQQPLRQQHLHQEHLHQEPLRQEHLLPSSSSRNSQRNYNSDSDCYSTQSTDRKQKSWRRKHKRKSRTSNRVRFKEKDTSFSDNDLDLSFQELERRQDILESTTRREKSRRDREFDELSLKTAMLKSIEDMKVKENEKLNGKLKEIQDKIAEEHATWKKQQTEMENMASEMKSLKDSVKEVLTPKPIKKPSRIMEFSPEEDEDEKNVLIFQKKIRDNQKTISFLQEELLRKETEQKGIEDTVDEIQNLNTMKSNQLKLIEHQLQQEKTERLKLTSTVDDLQDKALNLEKERSEMLQLISDLKREASTNKMSLEKCQKTTIPELKLLLERSEQQRDRFYDCSTSLQTEVLQKDETLKKLIVEKDEIAKLLRAEQLQCSKHQNEVEHAHKKHGECEKELESLKNELVKYQKKIQVESKSKLELKEKAIKTIREYKLKCRDYERSIMQLKDKEVETSNDLNKRSDLETRLLTLQSQFHETSKRMEYLKNELVESEAHCHEEKSKYKELLMKQKEITEEYNMLKSDNDRIKLTLDRYQIDNEKLSSENKSLKIENSSLTQRIENTEMKTRELGNKLQEKHENILQSKEEDAALKYQLKSEQENYEKLEKSYDQMKVTLQNEIDQLKSEIESSERERHQAKQEMLQYSAKYEDLKENYEKESSETTSYKSVIQEMRTKLKSFIEENRKLKKQILKTESASKKKVLEERLSNVPQPVDLVDTKVDKKLDVSKVLTLIMGDMENLHRLLSYEEEEQSPVKEIPDNLPTEIQDRLKDFRNKFNSCFSVVRTLKERYYHHKLLIKKAQEKIKSQLNDKQELQTSFEQRLQQCKTKIDFYRGQISSLESQLTNASNATKDKDARIENLQSKVSTLTKHLEECTRALHASIEAEHERKKVLGEIEQLKCEREEHQKIDENFYRCSEKLDILSEQLDEARNSLTQIKKDGMDESLFTTKLIETFGSVSPSRKRKLFMFDSPISKSSLRTSDPARRSLINDNQKDPMSLNDDEFNEFLLTNKERSSTKTGNLIDDSIT